MTDSANHFWLRNMVVLGQGAPNQIRKIGKQMGRCLCLWSEKYGFVRVYPVPFGYVHDWEIIDVEVRKPSNDGRENSYVVYNYESEWKNLSKRIHAQKIINKRGNKKNKKLTRSEQLELLNKLPVSTFSQIRDNKMSFGLIKPSKIDIVLRQNRETSRMQMTLDDLDHCIINQRDFALIPYLIYECNGNCSSKHPHEQKFVEWGAYQYIRKNPNDLNHCLKLKDNYHIGEDDYLHYVLIGNIRKYTKTYVVIKLIRFKNK